MTESATYQDRQSGRVYANAIDMVNDYIARFGGAVGIRLRPLDESGYADIRHGSATVGINVLIPRGLLVFLSRIADVPAEGREAFYRKLLELNFLATGDGAFAIDRHRDAVYLRAMRPLSGLDYEEFAAMLHNLATVADTWDDRLQSMSFSKVAP